MPRENRKRGKKHKKQPAEEQPAEQHKQHDEEQQQAGPSWIVSGPNDSSNEVNPEAPFGYVDADVKAYFRTVDGQLKEWQENRAETEAEDEDADPNENRRMFLLASLQEMTGKERELATDPDCAGILERMAYSMDDVVCRVFMDSLSGSFEQLVRHRFASHVVQTMLDVGAQTVAREARGILPKMDQAPDEGELRTFTQLVLNLAEELLPTLSSLILDPFASHVIRSLLLLLSPHLFPSDAKSPSPVRSKKSAAWKAKQGPMKSVFGDDRQGSKTESTKAHPKEFSAAAKSFVETLKEALGENEVRALAANKVASPVLQMLLEIEADHHMSDEPNSLMDHVLVGLITLHHQNPEATPEASDYLGTLLRDATSSHLLETLVTRSPAPIFDKIWSTYFVGKLARLAAHPVANFVVAKALESVSADQVGGVLSELKDALPKIRSSRTGVLRALVDRAASLNAMQSEVCETICIAFDLETPEDRKLLAPCILCLKPLQEYKNAVAASEAKSSEPQAAEPPRKKYRKDTDEDPLEPKIGGALLLQSLLRLADPHNQLVTSSISALSPPALLALTRHPISSRVLDVYLSSPTVVPRAKRTLLLSFLGRYHELVDDRIGSRVGDRCWATADPYLKEKIARSLIPHETDLAASFYGKFFARNLHLRLLQRRPDDWRNMVSTSSAPSDINLPPSKPQQYAISTGGEPQAKAGKKNKRKREGDEIDELFDVALGSKIKRAALMPSIDDTGHAHEPKEAKPADQKKKKDKGEAGKDTRAADGLDEVLSAIRAAPKGDEGTKPTKRKRDQ